MAPRLVIIDDQGRGEEERVEEEEGGVGIREPSR